MDQWFSSGMFVCLVFPKIPLATLSKYPINPPHTHPKFPLLALNIFLCSVLFMSLPTIFYGDIIS